MSTVRRRIGLITLTAALGLAFSALGCGKAAPTGPEAQPAAPPSEAQTRRDQSAVGDAAHIAPPQIDPWAPTKVVRNAVVPFSLPIDEGPEPGADEKPAISALAELRVHDGAVLLTVGNVIRTGMQARRSIRLGTLADITNHQSGSQPVLSEAFFSIIVEIRQFSPGSNPANLGRIEIDIADSASQPYGHRSGATVPWGYVVLVIDAVTRLRQELVAAGSPESVLPLTFRNTEPGIITRGTSLTAFPAAGESWNGKAICLPMAGTVVPGPGEADDDSRVVIVATQVEGREGAWYMMVGKDGTPVRRVEELAASLTKVVWPDERPDTGMGLSDRTVLVYADAAMPSHYFGVILAASVQAGLHKFQVAVVPPPVRG